MADGENTCDVVDSWEDIDHSQMFQGPMLVKKTSEISTTSILVKEDTIRSQYVPPAPTVTILKRPSNEQRLNATGDSCVNGAGKPIKTLQQREAEYAEARLRILGKASSTEFDINDRLERYDQTTESSAVYMLMRPQTDLDKCPPGVLRNPRGPDDSSGFTLRR